jgi:hypothetical protein
MVGEWWEESLRPVWSPTVVVGAVLGESEAVRCRAARRIGRTGSQADVAHVCVL